MPREVRSGGCPSRWPSRWSAHARLPRGDAGRMLADVRVGEQRAGGRRRGLRAARSGGGSVGSEGGAARFAASASLAVRALEEAGGRFEVSLGAGDPRQAEEVRLA